MENQKQTDNLENPQELPPEKDYLLSNEEISKVYDDELYKGNIVKGDAGGVDLDRYIKEISGETENYTRNKATEPVDLGEGMKAEIIRSGLIPLPYSVDEAIQQHKYLDSIVEQEKENISKKDSYLYKNVYPNHICKISVPIWGDSSSRSKQADDENTINIDLNIKSATWEKNDYNHADSLKITVLMKDCGVDPRLLSNGIIKYYLNVAEDPYKIYTECDVVFIGVIVSVERSADESNELVDIEALDYTTFFLEAKEFPPYMLPNYKMTLEQVWEKICTYTGGKDINGKWFSSVAFLKDRLAIQSGLDTKLSSVVYKRLQDGHITLKPNSTAWDVWQHCVGLLGYISWIDKETVFVTNTTEYYQEVNKEIPVLIYGNNISSIKEKRNSCFSGKRVKLVSYSPRNHSLIEAYYPLLEWKKVEVDVPATDTEAARKKSKIVGVGKHDDYIVYQMHGVTEYDALQRIAKKVYEEQSRQELEGTIVTSDTYVGSINTSGLVYNLLNLRAGECITIKIGNEERIPNTTKEGMISYLKNIGYNDVMAELIANNKLALGKFSDTFHVKRVCTRLECDETGGSFTTEISYQNRIDVYDSGTVQTKADAK